MKQQSIFGNPVDSKASSAILIPGLKKGKKKHEEKVQLSFCKFVKKIYPDVIFTCDLASGLKLPVHVGALHKKMRSSRAHCDFSASEPKLEYHGFFLELKKDSGEVFCKDGVTFKKAKTPIKLGNKIVGHYDHIQEQWEMIQKLRKKGYWADFGLGLQDSIDKFVAYMELKK